MSPQTAEGMGGTGDGAEALPGRGDGSLRQYRGEMIRPVFAGKGGGSCCIVFGPCWDRLAGQAQTRNESNDGVSLGFCRLRVKRGGGVQGSGWSFQGAPCGAGA